MLVELFSAIQESAQARELVIDDRSYTTRPAFPVLEPLPKPLELSNLSSIVEYVKSVAENDGADPSKLIVHVESPFVASVISPIVGEFDQRPVHAQAREFFSWKGAGQWMTPEQFIVMLRSQFLEDDETARILAVVGNIEDSAVKRTADDGVTQQVTVSAGIVRRTDVAVPSRVTLTPFRSFVEAQQAPSQFVLRMQSGNGEAPPSIALFEADGGAWRNAAMANVRAWLVERLPTGVVVLA
jgi:hypothetical protein